MYTTGIHFTHRITKYDNSIHYKHIFKRSTFGGVIFVSNMRGFGLVVSEVKTIWIKLYGHSANVSHVLGISLDFCRWGRRFTCLTMGSSTLYEFEKVYFAPNMRDFELVVCKAKLFG